MMTSTGSRVNWLTLNLASYASSNKRRRRTTEEDDGGGGSNVRTLIEVDNTEYSPCLTVRRRVSVRLGAVNNWRKSRIGGAPDDFNVQSNLVVSLDFASPNFFKYVTIMPSTATSPMAPPKMMRQVWFKAI